MAISRLLWFIFDDLGLIKWTIVELLTFVLLVASVRIFYGDQLDKSVIEWRRETSNAQKNEKTSTPQPRSPKWVVSRSLKSVGPNATLVEADIEAVIRGLKARLVGEIAVSGPDLARSLTDLGLIDEYRLYFHPVVLGRGKPFFAGPRPPLRLVSTDPVGEDTVRLTYVPA